MARFKHGIMPAAPKGPGASHSGTERAMAPRRKAVCVLIWATLTGQTLALSPGGFSKSHEGLHRPPLPEMEVRPRPYAQTYTNLKHHLRRTLGLKHHDARVKTGVSPRIHHSIFDAVDAAKPPLCCCYRQDDWIVRAKDVACKMFQSDTVECPEQRWGPGQDGTKVLVSPKSTDKKPAMIHVNLQTHPRLRAFCKAYVELAAITAEPEEDFRLEEAVLAAKHYQIHGKVFDNKIMDEAMEKLKEMKGEGYILPEPNEEDDVCCCAHEECDSKGPTHCAVVEPKKEKGEHPLKCPGFLITKSTGTTDPEKMYVRVAPASAAPDNVRQPIIPDEETNNTYACDLMEQFRGTQKAVRKVFNEIYYKFDEEDRITKEDREAFKTQLDEVEKNLSSLPNETDAIAQIPENQTMHGLDRKIEEVEMMKIELKDIREKVEGGAALAIKLLERAIRKSAAVNDDNVDELIKKLTDTIEDAKKEEEDNDELKKKIEEAEATKKLLEAIKKANGVVMTAKDLPYKPEEGATEVSTDTPELDDAKKGLDDAMGKAKAAAGTGTEGDAATSEASAEELTKALNEAFDKAGDDDDKVAARIKKLGAAIKNAKKSKDAGVKKLSKKAGKAKKLLEAIKEAVKAIKDEGEKASDELVKKQQDKLDTSVKDASGGGGDQDAEVKPVVEKATRQKDQLDKLVKLIEAINGGKGALEAEEEGKADAIKTITDAKGALPEKPAEDIHKFWSGEADKVIAQLKGEPKNDAAEEKPKDDTKGGDDSEDDEEEDDEEEGLAAVVQKAEQIADRLDAIIAMMKALKAAQWILERTKKEDAMQLMQDIAKAIKDLEAAKKPFEEDQDPKGETDEGTGPADNADAGGQTEKNKEKTDGVDTPNKDDDASVERLEKDWIGKANDEIELLEGLQKGNNAKLQLMLEQLKAKLEHAIANAGDENSKPSEQDKVLTESTSMIQDSNREADIEAAREGGVNAGSLKGYEEVWALKDEADKVHLEVLKAAEEVLDSTRGHDEAAEKTISDARGELDKAIKDKLKDSTEKVKQYAAKLMGHMQRIEALMTALRGGDKALEAKDAAVKNLNDDGADDGGDDKVTAGLNDARTAVEQAKKDLEEWAAGHKLADHWYKEADEMIKKLSEGVLEIEKEKKMSGERKAQKEKERNDLAIKGLDDAMKGAGDPKDNIPTRSSTINGAISKVVDTSDEEVKNKKSAAEAAEKLLNAMKAAVEALTTKGEKADADFVQAELDKLGKEKGGLDKSDDNNVKEVLQKMRNMENQLAKLKALTEAIAEGKAALDTNDVQQMESASKKIEKNKTELPATPDETLHKVWTELADNMIKELAGAVEVKKDGDKKMKEARQALENALKSAKDINSGEEGQKVIDALQEAIKKAQGQDKLQEQMKHAEAAKILLEAFESAVKALLEKGTGADATLVATQADTLGKKVAETGGDATGPVESVAQKVKNLKEQLEKLKALIEAIQEGRDILGGGQGEIGAAKTKITSAKDALNENPANAIAKLWKTEADNVIAKLLKKDDDDKKAKAETEKLKNELKSKTDAGEQIVKDTSAVIADVTAAEAALQKAYSAAKDNNGVDAALKDNAEQVLKSLTDLITKLQGEAAAATDNIKKLSDDLQAKTEKGGKTAGESKASKEQLIAAKEALTKAHSAADGKGVDQELMVKAKEVINKLEKLITDYKSGDPTSCIIVTDKCKVTQRRLASVASLSPLGASRSPAGAPHRLAEIVHSVLGRNHSHAAASQGAHGFPLVRRLTAPFRKALSRALWGSARGKAHRVALGNDCCVEVKCDDDSISDEEMCPEKNGVAFVRKDSDKPVKSKEEAGTTCCIEDPLNAALNEKDSPWEKKSTGGIGLVPKYSQIEFATCTYTKESIWACAGGEDQKKGTKYTDEVEKMKSPADKLRASILKLPNVDLPKAFPKYNNDEEEKKVTRIGQSLAKILTGGTVTLKEVIVKGEIKAGGDKERPVAVFAIAVARALKVLRGLEKEVNIPALKTAIQATQDCVKKIYAIEGTMTGKTEGQKMEGKIPKECRSMVGVNAKTPQISMRFRY